MDASLSLPPRVNITGDICLADCATTHSILQKKKYFSQLTLAPSNVTTISGSINLIDGSGTATIILPGGTILHLQDALYSTQSKRNLLSFKDIRWNGYHLETMSDETSEFLLITVTHDCKKCILEKLRSLECGLYLTTINTVESYSSLNSKFSNSPLIVLWHERLGHPGTSMLRRILHQSNGHSLTNGRISSHNHYNCIACTQGKFITRPSSLKVDSDPPQFLERIQGDICGHIDPPSGPFRYFMVLVNASTRWSHVCLLSTRNLAFARLLAQLIKLQAHFPDHPIKTIHLDNAGEFSSKAFHDYCMPLGIEIQYPVAHTHTQNGLAESFIKNLQWIARPLLLRTKLPLSAWGHALLHAGNLIRLHPIGDHDFSPLQIVSRSQPNISHLRVFGCAVYVPIPPNQRSKMGHQRRLGIYVGFRSTSIIQYHEPLTGNLVTARFADCHFDESVFPPLGGDKLIYNKWREITWNTPSLLHLDPRTKQSELEVQRILHLQDLADQLPDAFTDPNKVIKSHIPAVNTPAHIEIPIGDSGNVIASTSKPRLKHGRPIGSKDSFPRKRKSNKLLTPVEYNFDEITPEEPITIQSAPVELNTLQGLKETVTRVAVTYQLSPMNEEISINYMNQG